MQPNCGKTPSDPIKFNAIRTKKQSEKKERGVMQQFGLMYRRLMVGPDRST
jgi:hypothetical protein